MSYTRKFNATITTRFDEPHKNLYEQTLKIINDLGVSKSKGSMLLIERGVKHTNNPEPLIKEVEKTVYVDRPGKTIEKKVYVPVLTPTPKDEHIKEPKPKEKKEDPKEEEKSSNGSNVGSWIVGLSAVALIGLGIYKSFTS